MPNMKNEIGLIKMHKSLTGFEDDWKDGEERVARALMTPAGKDFLEKIKKDEVSHYRFHGIGGSGIVGRILSSQFGNVNYSSPSNKMKSEKSNELQIYVSHSGNTKETLESFRKRSIFENKGVSVCSRNGSLYEKTVSNNNMMNDYNLAVDVTNDLPPRASLGLMLSVCYNLIKRCEKEINPGIWFPTFCPDKVQNALFDDKINKLVTKLNVSSNFKYSIPVFYSDESFSSVADRWATQINENCDSLAFSAVYPECFHNLVNGWSNKAYSIKTTHVAFLDSGDTNTVNNFKKLNKRFRDDDNLEIIPIFIDRIMDEYDLSKLELAMLIILTGDRVSLEMTRWITDSNCMAIDVIEDLKKK